MTADLARIAFESATRALDKQERVVEELRSRTGLLLAASSLTVAFLGQPALTGGRDVLALVALGAFALSIGACVYVLLPKSTFYFALSGRYVFENLYQFREDTPEVHRRLTYDLQRFWEGNDLIMQRLFLAFRIAAASLAVEVVALLARHQRYPFLDGRHAEPNAASRAAANSQCRSARNARWKRRRTQVLARSGSESRRWLCPC